jgi:cytochrome oxidase Cu insertion factor (SCO1/SenC/PrrC family)
MKVGTSLSRCVRDIYDGVVKTEEIMVIVARTNFDPEDDKQWNNIWEGYTGDDGMSFPEWILYKEHEQEFRDIALSLKKFGKLHQPRQYGAHPQRHDEYW